MAKAPVFRHGVPLTLAVFQCSECAFQSAYRQVVQNHTGGKRAGRCSNAEIVSEVCTLTTVPIGGTGPAIHANITGDNNTNTQSNTTFNLVYVGSAEERQSLEALLQREDTRRELANLPAHEVPGALLRLWKGADAPPQLQNIRVHGGKVDEVRGPGNVVSVPRSRFVKKTVSDMLVAADRHAEDADLREPQFEVSRRRKVSRLDAARMQAVGCRTTYELDAPGRQFLASANASVDTELDQL